MIAAGQALHRRSSHGSWLNGQLLLPLSDALAVLAAYVIVLGLFAFKPTFAALNQLRPERLVIDAVVLVGLLLVFARNGHYHERRPFWQEAGEVVVAFLTALLIDAALLFFLEIPASRPTVFGYWAVGGALLLTTRYLVKSWLRTRGQWTRQAVVLGTGANARDLALALLEDPMPAYRPVAFLTPNGDAEGGESLAVDQDLDLPVIGLGGNPFEVDRRFPGAHVMVALELEDFRATKAFVERLSRVHKDVEVVLPFRGLPTRRSYRTRYVNHDLTTIRLHQGLDVRWQAAAKRWFDVLGASAILVFVAPLFLVLSLLVLTTGRPVVFAHERIGRHGRPFRCLKFRTMAVDAEVRLREILARDPAAAEEWARTRKLKDDPRITPIGHWLRKTSLDELPQLINVLRGEMSLVGPRPVTREEVDWYGRGRLYYLQTRPGITGIWQVSGRNDVDFRRRVHLDTWYVKNWSLLRDIAILFMTVRVVFARQGAY